jgi:hypothetical protein
LDFHLSYDMLNNSNEFGAPILNSNFKTKFEFKTKEKNKMEKEKERKKPHSSPTCSELRPPLPPACAHVAHEPAQHAAHTRTPSASSAVAACQAPPVSLLLFIFPVPSPQPPPTKPR